MSAPQRLDSTFAALADSTRRAILARLASVEASVTKLAEPFAMSQPAISKHLTVLGRAGLITRGRDAQRRPCRLEPKPLAEATGWLEEYRRFWESRFQRLDSLLEEMKSEEQGEKTWRQEAIRESADEEHWNTATHHPYRPRDCRDACLRCAARARL